MRKLSDRTPLKLSILSDTHYYSPKVGTSGSAYEAALLRSQKMLCGSRELIISAFDRIAADDSSDILLISGDVTNDGEYVSHEEFRELCRSLQSRGKQIYLITSTHDFQESGYSRMYVGDKVEKTPAPKREELFEYYREFGPDRAICSRPEFLSYIVQLPNNCRLFALNDDGGFSEEMMEWIAEQSRDAREHNQTIIAMTHHPIIPPSPMYEIIGKGDMHRSYKTRRCELADLGIQIMLTGHSHTHNIGRIFSERGNAFYAISTASLAGYPAPIRRITVDPEAKTCIVDTDRLTKADGLDTGGLTLDEYLKKQLIGVVGDMLYAAGNDIKRFAYMAQAISIKPKLVYKYGWLIKPFFKWLGSVKFGTFARWTKKETGLTKQERSSIKDDRVVDFVITLVSNLFSGENNLSISDPKCRVYIGFLQIVDSLLRALHIDAEKLLGVVSSVTELLAPLACKGEFNAFECTLPLYDYVPEGEHREYPPEDETLKNTCKSRKGGAILAVGIVSVALLLPVILLVLISGFLFNRIRFAKQLGEKV